MSSVSTVAEVASPLPDRAAWGDPTILHPALPHERQPYRFAPEGYDHCRITRNRRHVADARRRPDGGWELFAVSRPTLALGWAANLAAMKLLAPEALAAQAAAAPGQYGWCLLIRQKVEVYWRSVAAARPEVA